MSFFLNAFGLYIFALLFVLVVIGVRCFIEAADAAPQGQSGGA